MASVMSGGVHTAKSSPGQSSLSCAMKALLRGPGFREVYLHSV